MIRYTVTPEDSGQRLGILLRRKLEVSYTAAKSAKWGGRILVNGASARVDYLLQPGDVVELLEAEATPLYIPAPYDFPLTIPWEDGHFVVIDKPARMASQSSLAHPDDSLENAFYAHLGCPSSFIYRPVNRLDKGTSGLMVVALDGHTQHLLQSRLHSPDFRRLYLAVLDGCPPQRFGTVDAPIAKESAHGIRRVVREDGQPSQTRYEVLAEHNGRSLVQLELMTGRTHQIRVHMACLGCPVFGDFLYGTESPELPGRFALHSARLLLKHPYSGELLEIASPLPEELQRLMEN